MKKYILSPFLFLIISVALLGCYTQYPIDHKKLTDIPLQNTKANPDVFIANETPKDDYVKIELFAVTGQDYNSITLQAKQMAVEKKLDGIIIVDNNTKIYSTYSTYYPRTYSVDQQIILGIKYVKNLGYLKDYINSLSFYAFPNGDTSAPNLLGKYEVNYRHELIFLNEILSASTNSIIEPFDKFRKYVYDLNDFFTVNQQNQYWGYQGQDSDPNPSGRVRKVRYADPNDTESKDLRTVEYYNTNQRLMKQKIIKIGSSGNTRETQKLYSYENENLKTINYYRNNLPFMTEKAYTYNGKLIQSIFYKAGTNSLTPLYKIEFNYFTDDDIAKLANTLQNH